MQAPHTLQANVACRHADVRLRAKELDRAVEILPDGIWSHRPIGR